nr:hypothetical protein [Kibdelosporangium sp. MJ126-NF4]CEL13987.1 hypothetical protein [Kibdelosporangium sp. MJ126-NF4]CTQ88355.1 hypothetical protein [Kibdelosporangium sp. MJ126-NF4]
MSFNAFANHVRNPALPFGRRVVALRCCVQLYRPIGYHATLGYLAILAGPFQHEEAALLRALDALSASRASWHADLEQYAQVRRVAKRKGQRSPRPRDPNPNTGPHYWYGAPQKAAAYALLTWRGQNHGVVSRFSSLVDSSLAADGALTPAQRDRLDFEVDMVRRSIRAGLYSIDYAAYGYARELLVVAHHLRIAADYSS